MDPPAAITGPDLHEDRGAIAQKPHKKRALPVDYMHNILLNIIYILYNINNQIIRSKKINKF